MCMYSMKTRCSGAAQFFFFSFMFFLANMPWLKKNMSLYFFRNKLRSIYIYIDLTFKSDTKIICNRSNMFISIIELSACSGDVICPLKRKSFSVSNWLLLIETFTWFIHISTFWMLANYYGAITILTPLFSARYPIFKYLKNYSIKIILIVWCAQCENYWKCLNRINGVE